MKSFPHSRAALALLAAPMLWAPAAIRAQIVTNFPAPSILTKQGGPSGWLSAASVAVREGYDTNLFGVSTTPAGQPNVANVSTWFTTVSAGVVLNAAPGFASPSGESFFQTLTLTYAADYTAYEAVAREDNLRNTLTLSVRGRSGPWSLAFDNPLLYVDGSKEDPFFSQYNNLGYGPTRERRNQIQERDTGFVRYDGTDWFARVVDSVTYYNLLIDEHNPVGAYKGYVNWVNRDNINVGPDFGYKIAPDFSLVTGWRIGQQTQATPYYTLVDNNNTYNRVLLGFEGKLFSRAQVQLLAGPDYRRYSDGSNSGIAGNRHTWLYAESQVSVTLSTADTFTANGKVWHWVSSTGVSSIQETLENYLFTHTFSPQLSASAGFSVTGHRYDYPAVRNDWTHSYPVDVTYAFTRRFSISADYNDISGATHLSPLVSPGQNFSENTASVQIKASF
jgi:hypothetical protein